MKKCMKVEFSEACIWQEFTEDMLKVYSGLGISYIEMLKIVSKVRLCFDKQIEKKIKEVLSK